MTRKEMPQTAAEHPAARRSGGLRTFRALAFRDFRYLWLGQITNSASIWTEQVARPLLVLDLVPDPSQAAVHLGLVLGARTLPQLGFGLIGGVFADWYDRRTLLLVSKTISMLINIVFAAMLVLGVVELWHVYATTILRGIATSFDQPARQALIPALVPSEDVTNAVALNSASMQTMRIGGGFLAGILVVLTGIAGAFVAVALFSAGAVFFTIFLRVPPAPSVDDKSVGAAASSFWEGLKYGWHEIDIRGTFVLTLVYFLLGMAYLQVFAPLFAKQVMGLGDEGYGIMVSVAGIGALIGALWVATFAPTRGRGPLMLGFMATLGALLMGFGASTYTPWFGLTFLAIALVGMIQSTFFALANSVLLETTRADMRGRVMGLLSLDRSAITLGGTIAGFLSAAIGPQIAQMLFGAGCVVLAISLATLLPSVRRLQ